MPRYVPDSTTHMIQGERIVDLTLTEEESAAATLLQLGLRVPGLTLPQDPASAHLEGETIDINEHADLYLERQESQRVDPSSTRSAAHFFRQFASVARHEAGPKLSNGLPRYFSSLPARNVNNTEIQVSTAIATESEASHAPHVVPSATDQPNDPPPLFDDDTHRDEGLSFRPDSRHDRVGPEQPQTQTETDDIRDEAPYIVRGSEDLLGADQLRSHYTTRSRRSSADTSELDFASHRSMSNELEENTAEESAEDYIAHKLCEQLYGGFHGCFDEDHEAHHCQHMNEAGSNHHSLGAVFNDPRFPSVLGLQGMITPERLHRERTPTAAQWEALFCGTGEGPDRRLPMNVCLHEEQTRAVEPEIAYDIDSFLGFADSLAVARKGLWYQPAPQMRQNMTADVHLETKAYDSGTDGQERSSRSRMAMLRDIPHFLLGRVEGAHDIALYVLFPHIAIGGDKFSSLTREQLSRWTDQIYLPALHKFYQAHYTQHLPASHRNAYDDSKAHQVESRQVQTASYQAQQSIGYHLQPEHLDEIWHDVLQTINTTPGFGDFRDAELFVSAKGTKLQFKTGVSRPALKDAMDHFETYVRDVIDFDFLRTDRFYVDIGKEICPHASTVASQTQHRDDEAQVLLWKRCCLESYMSWMYDGQPPTRNNRGQQYFIQNMLYDAGALTSVTPKRSKHREGGLVYSQFYASVKELYDATKCFPFSNDAMEELALDPQIRTAARNIAGGHRRDAKIVEAGYLASKRRTNGALIDARRKSFGIREEHRVRWGLFQRLRTMLESGSADGETRMSDCPSYAWAIRSETYMDFLWRSADKFAAGFEIVRARSRADLVTWEQTKMMAMFLRCLRYVFGGHLLSRESALWWSRREGRRSDDDQQQTQVWYGLGFRNTLPEYKYCWLEPRIDWTRLQFKPGVTDRVLFGNGVLRGQYLRRGGQVQHFFDRTRQLDVALVWLDQHAHVTVVRKRLVSWIAHLCLVQFRVDVLHAVTGEVRAELREEVSKGLVGFSFEYLDEVMTQGCYLMSGNKTDFKQTEQLGHFLFDWDDGLIRDHWEKRGYRVLYQRARESLRQRGRGLDASFTRRFWPWLFAYHWVLPYPCGNALLQTTKQGRRMWYSIRSHEDENGAPSWVWARKDWKVGRPASLPEYVEWDQATWEKWIARHERPRAR